MAEFKCPTCGRAVLFDRSKPEGRYFPFCSEKCRLVDLGKWFDEDYVIETPLRQVDIEE